MFKPSFPSVPDKESISRALKNGYGAKKCRMSCSGLHLKTKEAYISKYDNPIVFPFFCYKPRPDLPEVDFSDSLEWNMDPFGDRNWCLHLNSFRFLDRSFLNFEKTRVERFLRFPIDIVLSYSDFHFEKGGLVVQHRFFFDDMTMAIRQLRLSYLVDKVLSGYVDLEEDEIDKISSIILFQWQALSHISNFKSTNHTISLIHALASIVETLGKAGCADYVSWNNELMRCFDYLVSYQFDDSGVHVENSPEYHFFSLKLFLGLMESGWYDDASESSIKRLRLAENVSQWMLMPDKRIVPIGDSNAKPPIASPLVHSFETLNDPISDETLKSFIHPLYSFVKKSISKDSWSFLAVKSGHCSEVHRHKDDLSFLWSESNFDLIVDAGKYAYTQKDKFRDFVKGVRAHNTISTFKMEEGYKRLFDFNASYDKPRLQITEYGCCLEYAKLFEKNAGRVSRKIYFRPGSWLVIEDIVRCPDLEFESFVHFSPEFSWKIGGDCVVGELVHSNLNDIVLSTEVFSNSIVNVRKSDGGEVEPQLNGFVSRYYKKVERAPFIEVSGRDSANIIYSFSLDGKVGLSFSNSCLTVRDSNSSWVL